MDAKGINSIELRPTFQVSGGPFHEIPKQKTNTAQIMKHTATAKFSMALGLLLAAMPLMGRAQTVIYSDSFETDTLNTTHPVGWTDVATGVSAGGGYAAVQGTATFSGTYSGLNGVHAAYLYLQGLSGTTAPFQGNDFSNANIGQTFAPNTTYTLNYLYGEYGGGGPTTISFMGNDSVVLTTQKTIVGGTTALTAGSTVTIDTASNPRLVGQDIGIDMNWAPYTGLYFRSVGIDNIQVKSTPDITKSSMGINLEPSEFVDLIKDLGQGAFKQVNKDANGNYVPATLDANGWPTQDFLVGIWGNGHAIVLNDAENFDVSGTYSISFQCANPHPVITGTPNALTITGSTSTSDGTGQFLITANLYLPAQPPRADGTASYSLNFKITGTTQGSISGVRNMKLIPPGYPLNTTQVFTTDYLNLLKPYSLLRAMDLSLTNGAPVYPAVTAWTDRTPPNYATTSSNGKFNGGQPWEYIILLANTANADLWINVPIAATDDYVTKLAQLFKYGSDANGNPYTSVQSSPIHPPLNPNLHLYVEYSNEVWNKSFTQSVWNRAAGQDEFTNGASPVTLPANLKPLGASDYSDATFAGPANRVAERLVQISNIFGSVWGASAINTTIRPVYAWKLGGGDEAQCAWIQANYGAPKNYIYALAAAPYLGTAVTQSYTSTGLTKEACIADMESSIKSQHPYLTNLRCGATYYGLQDITYEGGVGMTYSGDFQAKYDSQYLVGINGGQDGIDTVLTKYYNNYFVNEGGDLNVYFNVSGDWEQYGLWGIVENNADPRTATRALPKWNAINSISAAPRPVSTAGIAVPATGVRANIADYLIGVNNLVSTQFVTNGIYQSTDPGHAYYRAFFSPQTPSDPANPSVVLEYLINVATAGTYTIKQSCASTNPQTPVNGDNTSGPATLQLFVDNSLTPPPIVNVPTTTGYNNGFVDVTLGTMFLTKGYHTIHVNVLHAANSTKTHILGISQLVVTP